MDLSLGFELILFNNIYSFGRVKRPWLESRILWIPLVPFSTLDDFLELEDKSIVGADVYTTVIASLLKQMPLRNFRVLHGVMYVFHRVAQFEEKNKMSPQNLSKVISEVPKALSNI